MRPRWLFIASCISLVTSAFTFVVRGDVLQAMGNTFGLSQGDKGWVEGAVFFGMAISMLIGGFICDLLGMKRIMFLAFACHLIGSVGTIGAPVVFQGLSFIFAGDAYLRFLWLFVASFLMGCGNGMVETGINPLAATLYPTQKTHYLNILHAWWPGGLIIGGVAAKFVGGGIDLGFVYIPGMGLGWQTSLMLIVIPCLVYGAMLIGQVFPLTERVASGVSTFDMFKEAIRPAFLIWAFCMLLTAATELGPQKWQESVMSRTAGISGTMILVYTSGLMFVMRFFAGPLAHRISPVGMLTVSAALSAVGLYLLSTATGWLTAFAFATIFGIGIAYFWPTMLGVTAERFPKGGALLLCLMGSVGNLSIFYVLPKMGQVYDHYAVASLHQPHPGIPVEGANPAKPHPDLADKVVQGGAINQGVAQKVGLLVKLNDDERKAIDPANWLTPEQRQELKPSDGPEGLKITAEDLKRLDLTPEQSFILSNLIDSEGTDAERREAIAKQLRKSGTAGPQQAVLAEMGEARNVVGGLSLLRDVHNAGLKPEQKETVAATLDQRGQKTARNKFMDKDFDPGTLTTQERKAVEAALPGPSASFYTQDQLRIMADQKAIADAEATGASMAFRWVSVLPCILIFVFGAIALTDLLRGGYKAVHIHDGHADRVAHVPPGDGAREEAIRAADDAIRR